MPRSNSFGQDLAALSPRAQRSALALRRIFAISATIGVIAFIIHFVVFFTAMRHGAATPTGTRVYGIIEHGHSAYVTYAEHQCIKVFEIVMIAGLGVGVPGELALEALVRKVSRKQPKREIRN